MFALSCIVVGMLLGLYHSEVENGISDDSRKILIKLTCLAIFICVILYFVEK